MPYPIIYGKKVVNGDIPKIPPNIKPIIIRAINERLAVAPLDYGKQLRYSLKDQRCLRVGDWRIAYKFEEGSVKITRIQNRRDAYKDW